MMSSNQEGPEPPLPRLKERNRLPFYKASVILLEMKFGIPVNENPLEGYGTCRSCRLAVPSLFGLPNKLRFPGPHLQEPER